MPPMAKTRSGRPMISARARPEHGELFAGRHLAGMRPALDVDAGGDGDDESEADPGIERVIDRQRKDHAAIADEDVGQHLPRLARARRADPQYVPPDDELQQQRDVAHGLDIECGQLVDQPVGRQPRDAHDRAEDGRQHDADAGDAERVEQADQQRPAISVGGRVFDEGIRRSRRRPRDGGSRSRWRCPGVPDSRACCGRDRRRRR